MLTRISAFLRDDEGATSIEYGLIGSMVAVWCIAALTFFGNSVSTKFSEIGSSVQAAGS